MTMKTGFGINVTKWCNSHEQYIENRIQAGLSAEDAGALMALHEKKLSWLMHERLIHLIVLFITVVLVLFSLALVLFAPDTFPASLIMFAILFVLLIFYVKHYFFLENTVQRWYVIDDELQKSVKRDGSF